MSEVPRLEEWLLYFSEWTDECVICASRAYKGEIEVKHLMIHDVISVWQDESTEEVFVETAEGLKYTLGEPFIPYIRLYE
jgi:hypothetical protein